MNHLSGKLVHAYLRRIPGFDIRQLRFAIIRLHPFRGFDERDYLCSWGNQLSRAHLPLADGAVSRRKNLGVTQVHLRRGKSRLPAVEIGG